MNYFIKVNNAEHGPFSVDQLIEFGINANYQIRPENSSSGCWLQATDLIELMPLIEIYKQELNVIAETNSYETAPLQTDISMTECPKSHLSRSLISILFFFPTGIAATVKSSLVKRRFRQHLYYDAQWLSKTSLICSRISFIIGIFFYSLIACIKLYSYFKVV